MSKVYRRYEMLLPLRFNDGQPIPGESKFQQIDIWMTTYLVEVV